MSRYGEKQLICHLLDEDSLAALALGDFKLELVPTPDLRGIINFSIEYYMGSGRQMAPTVEVFESHEISVGRTIANALDDMEIPWREGAETSLDWVILDLESSYLSQKANTLTKEISQKLAESDAESRLDVFSEYVTQGAQLVLDMQKSRTRVNLVTHMEHRMWAYEDRVSNAHLKTGLTLGLDAVDDATGRLHKGELAMLAAFAKLGKSYALDRIALLAHREGMPVALATLENSIDMTMDRMACLATGVDPTRWQRGECVDIEVQRVRDWISDLQKSDVPLHILSPDPGQRTPQAMVRAAQILEVDALIVDQLSHIEHPNPSRKRPDIIETEKLRQLRLLCATGRSPMSCLVAHQINREGKKAADKRNWHEMYDLAETSGAERETDLVLSMYQGTSRIPYNQVLLQILAFRRGPIKWWEIKWRMDVGEARILAERVPYENVDL